MKTPIPIYGGDIKEKKTIWVYVQKKNISFD